MAKFFSLRTCLRATGATGIVAAAAFGLASLDPFMSAAPDAGAKSLGTAPVSVNRANKGDRLPVAPPALSNSRLWPDIWPDAFPVPPTPQPLRAQQFQARHIPVGCEAAFSPISSPLLAHVYGRCMT